MSPKQNVDELYEEICEAFAHVELGDGIGLWEAQAIDDYADCATRRAFRERDEKQNWSAISRDDLDQCNSSPSFFDAKGMLFHLPAMLTANLSGRSEVNVVFYLTTLDEWSLDRFRLLNSRQRSVVRRFLEFVLQSSDYDFEKHDIVRALVRYWKD